MKKQYNRGTTPHDPSELVRCLSQQLNHQPTVEEVQTHYDKAMAEEAQDFEWARKAMFRVAKRLGVDHGALRLLEAMYKTPAKADREAYNARMEYLCVAVGKVYDPNRPITIGDLRKVNPELVIELFETIYGVEPDVRVDSNGKTWYLWPMSYKDYTVQEMWFAVGDETFLTCDESGYIESFVKPYICPYLVAELDLNLPAHTYRMLLGALRQEMVGNEQILYFEPTNSLAATHILLIAEWGGPSSTTRGAENVYQLKEVDVNCFRKVSSKKGGQGCDLCFIQLEQSDGRNLYECVADYETAHAVRQAAAMATFERKLSLVEQIDRQQSECEDAVASVRNRIAEINKDCAESQVSRLPWVTCPEYGLDVPELCGTCPGEFQESSLDMSLDALEEMLEDISAARISEKLERYVRKIRAEAETWLVFAPQYALLDVCVRVELHGYLEIEGRKAIVELPTRDGESEVLRREYYFSDGQVAKLRRDLYSYNQAELADFRNNYSVIDKLRDGHVLEATELAPELADKTKTEES